jgi:hypothetical protein
VKILLQNTGKMKEKLNLSRSVCGQFPAYNVPHKTTSERQTLLSWDPFIRNKALTLPTTTHTGVLNQSEQSSSASQSRNACFWRSYDGTTNAFQMY